MGKILIFFISFNIYYFISIAQIDEFNKPQKRTIDSLENLLKVKSGRGKVDILNFLGQEIHSLLPEKALEYEKRAVELSERLNYQLGKAKAYQNIGRCYFVLLDFEKEVEYCHKALAIYKKLGLKNETAEILNILCYPYRILGEYEKSLKYLDEGLKLYEELEDKNKIAANLRNIGLTYTSMSKYQDALEYFQKSMILSKELNDSMKISNLLSDIGFLYHNWGEFAKALDYQTKSLVIKEKLGDKGGVARSIFHIALVHFEIKNFDEALKYFKKYLEISKELGDKKSISHATSCLGAVHLEQGDYDKSLSYFQEALKIDLEMGHLKYIAANLQNIGIVYSKNKDYDNALKFYFNALPTYEELGDKRIISNCLRSIATTYREMGKDIEAIKISNQALNLCLKENLRGQMVDIYLDISKSYSNLENYNEALNYYKHYVGLKDSIFNKESGDKIAELKIQFETEEQEKENEILRKSSDIQDIKLSQANIFRNFIILTVGLIIVLIIVIYGRYKLKMRSHAILSETNIQIGKFNKELQMSNDDLEDRIKARIKNMTEEIEERKIAEKKLNGARKKAEESDKLKTHFLANMSHEIRTPMNAILGFSYLLAEPGLKKLAIQKYTDLVKNNGNILLKLIDDILDVAKIESEQIKIVKTDCQINKVLTELHLAFKQEIKKKENNKLDLNLIKAVEDEDFKIITDKSRLIQVLSNLLDNAIKYTELGVIEFGYILKGEKTIQFYVKDTGIGIPEEKIDQIFDRFRQVDDSHTRQFGGAGLGLTISRNFVELLGGKMWIKSTVDVGSTFYFTIPK